MAESTSLPSVAPAAAVSPALASLFLVRLDTQDIDWLFSPDSLAAARSCIKDLNFPAPVAAQLYAALDATDRYFCDRNGQVSNDSDVSRNALTDEYGDAGDSHDDLGVSSDISSSRSDIIALFAGESAAVESVRHLTHQLHDPTGVSILSVQLRCAALSRCLYGKAGLDDDLFLAGFAWFPRFVRWQRRFVPTDPIVFTEEMWAPRFLSLHIFRLGEFEYEFIEGNQPYINLHVPSDAVLEPERVTASFSALSAFMDRHCPEFRDCPVRCLSWLLFPALQDLLPDSSRIRCFQELFEITGEEYSNDFKKWIAGRHDISDADLPEHTTLQRTIKHFVLSGGRMGLGEGRLRIARSA